LYVVFLQLTIHIVPSSVLFVSVIDTTHTQRERERETERERERERKGGENSKREKRAGRCIFAQRSFQFYNA
jgi:hypothetical protein